MDLSRTAARVEATMDVVTRSVNALKDRDREKGYCSLTISKPKVGVVFPEPFDGSWGSNVYKFCEEIEDAIRSAKVKRSNEVKLLRKHLTNDAYQLIGKHHRTLDSALDALIKYFGNPRAIWTKTKRDLHDAVGNQRKDWGFYGQQKRVLAIARTKEFVEEAECLATEFPNILGSEVYSGSTIRLLYKIL